MFQIKICGITRLEDGLAATEAGADAIGFNFCRKSPRYVDPSKARELREKLSSSLMCVGVFVDAPVGEIVEAIEVAGLAAIQLHGEEPPEILVDLPANVSVIRAFRMREEGLEPLASYLQAALRRGRLPDAVLIDAYSPRAKGGTGCVVDWQQVRDEKAILGGMPLILAGGLTPRNVADAIGLVKPQGVDTASGVEISAGIKDAALIRGFVQAARESLA